MQYDFSQTVSQASDSLSSFLTSGVRTPCRQGWEKKGTDFEPKSEQNAKPLSMLKSRTSINTWRLFLTGATGWSTWLGGRDGKTLSVCSELSRLHAGSCEPYPKKPPAGAKRKRDTVGGTRFEKPCVRNYSMHLHAICINFALSSGSARWKDVRTHGVAAFAAHCALRPCRFGTFMEGYLLFSEFA